MTLRDHRQVLAETLHQFMTPLEVTWEEMVRSLPGEERERLLSELNDYRVEENRKTVSSVDQFTVGEIREWLLAEFGVEIHIENVLEERDTEYIHMYDGQVHTIIEIQEEANP